jgi:ACT domain-containing protein
MSSIASVVCENTLSVSFSLYLVYKKLVFLIAMKATEVAALTKIIKKIKKKSINIITINGTISIRNVNRVLFYQKFAVFRGVVFYAICTNVRACVFAKQIFEACEM